MNQEFTLFLTSFAANINDLRKTIGGKGQIITHRQEMINYFVSVSLFVCLVFGNISQHLSICSDYMIYPGFFRNCDENKFAMRIAVFNYLWLIRTAFDHLILCFPTRIVGVIAIVLITVIVVAVAIAVRMNRQ